jgi:ribosomal-protein-alanine N-acetyltransferase
MIYQLAGGYSVRPLRLSDIEGPYMSWFEDQEVTRWNSHGKFFKNADYFRDYLAGLNSEDQVTWAICHVADGHIGNISLQKISFIDRNADFGVLIGNRNHWAKGVSLEAGKLLIRHGFNKINLERIWCSTPATNVAMRKLAKKLGMAEEGCRRGHLFVDGAYVDMIEFGILRSECTYLDAPDK